MFMNNFDIELYTCTCRHICYSRFVCYNMYFFCCPLGSGVAFYSSGFGQHDHLDAVRQTKSNILRKKSVVVASLCSRFALMNEIG